MAILLKNHYLKCLASQESASYEVRASYVYLRGMFEAAQGNTGAALSDLLDLYSHNNLLVPTESVYQFVSYLEFFHTLKYFCCSR